MKSFEHYVRMYETYLQGLGRAPQTIQAHIYIVRRFITYIQELEKDSITDITSHDITTFIDYLVNTKSRRKAPMRPHTIRKRISDLRGFFRFLFRNEALLVNPMDDCTFIVSDDEPFKGIFTREEMATFLDAITTTRRKKKQGNL